MEAGVQVLPPLPCTYAARSLLPCLPSPLPAGRPFRTPPQPLPAHPLCNAGASLGPEGPSVDIGKSFAKGFASNLRSKQRHLTSFMAAGAGAGVAAGFNAPIAGGGWGGLHGWVCVAGRQLLATGDGVARAVCQSAGPGASITGSSFWASGAQQAAGAGPCSLPPIATLAAICLPHAHTLPPGCSRLRRNARAHRCLPHVSSSFALQACSLRLRRCCRSRSCLAPPAAVTCSRRHAGAPWCLPGAAHAPCFRPGMLAVHHAKTWHAAHAPAEAACCLGRSALPSARCSLQGPQLPQRLFHTPVLLPCFPSPCRSAPPSARCSPRASQLPWSCLPLCWQPW